jgi:hypothetical protein
MSPSRSISGVTHEAAVDAAVAQRQDARQRTAREEQAIKRAERQAKEREMERTAAQIPQRLVSRGVVGFDGAGKVRETFSCGCDKTEHGHGRNPFAGITEPTVLEFIDPTEKARELAERVDRVRSPKTPPAALLKSGSSGGGRPNPERRRR